MNRHYLNIIGFDIKSFEIGIGHDYPPKAQFAGLGNATGDASDRPYLTTQPHLAGHTDIARYGCVDIAGEHRGNDRQIDGWVGHSDAAGNVQENVFLCLLKADAFFQDSQQHIKPTEVETGGRALGCAVCSRRDQSLGLDKERSDAFNG